MTEAGRKADAATLARRTFVKEPGLSSTFRNSCRQAQSLHESVQESGGNFDGFALLLGEGKILRRPKDAANRGDRVAERGLGLVVPSCGKRADGGARGCRQSMRPDGYQRV